MTRIEISAILYSFKSEHKEKVSQYEEENSIIDDLWPFGYHYDLGRLQNNTGAKDCNAGHEC